MTKCVRVSWRHPTARWVMVCLALVICSALTAGRYVLHEMNHPTARLRKAELLEPTVPVGGTLYLYLTDVTPPAPNCQGYITREFRRRMVLKNGKIVWAKRRILAPAPPLAIANDEPDYVVEIDVPPKYPPGRYRFIGETGWDCGAWLGGLDKYLTAPVDFEIVTETEFKAQGLRTP